VAIGVLTIRRSSAARVLVASAALFAIVGLPALHQLVHELEEAAEADEPREHHHHEGDEDHPGEHGIDAPEHLGVALLAAPATVALPPPRVAPAPPAPLARRSVAPRLTPRRQLARGPPRRLSF
jgi:hypothetical protein